MTATPLRTELPRILVANSPDMDVFNIALPVTGDHDAAFVSSAVPVKKGGNRNMKFLPGTSAVPSAAALAADNGAVARAKKDEIPPSSAVVPVTPPTLQLSSTCDSSASSDSMPKKPSVNPSKTAGLAATETFTKNMEKWMGGSGGATKNTIKKEISTVSMTEDEDEASKPPIQPALPAKSSQPKPLPLRSVAPTAKPSGTGNPYSQKNLQAGLKALPKKPEGKPISVPTNNDSFSRAEMPSRGAKMAANKPKTEIVRQQPSKRESIRSVDTTSATRSGLQRKSSLSGASSSVSPARGVVGRKSESRRSVVVGLESGSPDKKNAGRGTGKLNKKGGGGGVASGKNRRGVVEDSSEDSSEEDERISSRPQNKKVKRNLEEASRKGKKAVEKSGGSDAETRIVDEDDDLIVMNSSSFAFTSSSTKSSPAAKKTAKKRARITNNDEPPPPPVKINRTPTFLDDHDSEDGKLRWCGLNVMLGDYVFATWPENNTVTAKSSPSKQKDGKRPRLLYSPCKIINYDPTTELFLLASPPDQPNPPPLARASFLTRLDPAFLTCKLHPDALSPYYDTHQQLHAQTHHAAADAAEIPEATEAVAHVQRVLDGTCSSVLMDAMRRGDMRAVQGLGLDLGTIETIEYKVSEIAAWARARGVAVEVGEEEERVLEAVLKRDVRFPDGVVEEVGGGSGEDELGNVLRRDRVVAWVLLPEAVKMIRGVRYRRVEERMVKEKREGVDSVMGEGEAAAAEAAAVAGLLRPVQRIQVDWVRRMLTLRESLSLGKRVRDDRNE
ncbi:hypothetical protein HDU98_008190 [Podochytrium sp. JEL0797]|nr:hypothetical protein HDU98_008190 [Podochytrium sp. JEL0797]